MKKITLLLLLAFFASWGIHVPANSQKKNNIYHKGWIDFNKNGIKDIYEDPERSIDERVEDLLKQMTVEEKTNQMVTLYGYGRVQDTELPNPSWKEKLWKDGLANIDEASNGVVKNSKYKLPYSKHTWALNEIQKFFVEETRLGIPVEFTNEGIRGLNHTKSTNFPAQIGLGSTWNKDLIHQVGEVVGSEAYVLGYHNVYAPILDIARDQRWGRTVECYGEDPFLVAEMGIAMSKGLQSQGVTNTMKHFAVYSTPNGGRDGDCRTDPHLTPREVHELYLYPFKKTIKEANPLAVMSSYNDYDGEPITGSEYFLTDLLRKDYGFEGYVITDSDALAHIWSKHNVAHDYKEAVRQAVIAGVNVRTTFNDPANFVMPLRELIQEGQISIDLIDERVKDVLKVKFIEGLFDEPYRSTKNVDKLVANEANHALSLETSRQSIVLLKNQDDILPLDRNKVKNILVTGPNAKATSHSVCRYGSLEIDVMSGYEGIKKIAGEGVNVDFALGCELYDKNWPASEILPFSLDASEEAYFAEAEEKAKENDVVIVFVGESEESVGESVSRTSLDLPGRQKELIQRLQATGTPVIAVLINGRPLSVNYEQAYVPAILEAWFPGQFGGQAIAEVIFGDYNPGGKLPITFPRTVGQIPLTFPSKPAAHGGQHKKGDPNGSGNSRIVDALYPFGFGLSYSKFEYSNLKISPEVQGVQGEITISADIKNVSNRKGDEVVQLYINDRLSSVTTYTQLLKGFERITLEPNETKTVTFTLKSEELTLFTTDLKEVIELGEFDVWVGASSEDLRLEGMFELR
ncbi:glycoside hydrolase family 3 N-terminal domain-containing protein [Aureibacter tunicatorum]|uniref:Beta-glucosidase n=1 Tax=Aureibacter tunicatorum TaxID=866807 RepID=A0AAE3XKS9_9BACT|nr:glycoside hydrolase family 3 N-terminal domain-containing protein [Aureibacter tunicatorum]MDR6237750.1 beta-glucosidase [Aureibacter tunicatorum]BDD02785.1 beta-glucosidase [Aureibacter tunicatorum]